MLRRLVREGAMIVVSAAVAAIVTVLLLRGSASPPAVAQASLQVPEVRASRFILVDAGGTPRASLEVVEGFVNLRFFDETGALHTQIGEGGVVGFLGEYEIGFALTAGAGGPGLVLWSGEGAQRTGLSPMGLAIFDTAGTPRIRVGETLDAAAGDTSDPGYSVEVRVAGGELIGRLP